MYFVSTSRTDIAWLNNVDVFTNGPKDKLFKQFNRWEESLDEAKRKELVLYLQTSFGAYLIYRCKTRDERGAVILTLHDSSVFMIAPYDNWIRDRLQLPQNPLEQI